MILIKMNDLRKNIDKLHTTFLGEKRIRNNLNLPNIDILNYCKDIILNEKCNICVQGKNFYCLYADIIITVNVSSFTVITAHLQK